MGSGSEKTDENAFGTLRPMEMMAIMGWSLPWILVLLSSTERPSVPVRNICPKGSRQTSNTQHSSVAHGNVRPMLQTTYSYMTAPFSLSCSHSSFFFSSAHRSICASFREHRIAMLADSSNDPR